MPHARLVIGKFAPFHKGHQYLISRALEDLEPVHVVVYDNPLKPWPWSGEERAQWIRDEFKGLPIEVSVLSTPLYDDYDDPNLWAAHDTALQYHLRKHRVTVAEVWGSEQYVSILAEQFATSVYKPDAVFVDIDREKFHISGTEVRADFWSNWSMLPLATRLAVMPRVVVMGAESTGTTTLSRDLANHYQAAWVPEWGRTYTQELVDSGFPMHRIDWTMDDFLSIAVRQTRMEDAAVAKVTSGQNPLLIADTDARATREWMLRYITQWGLEQEAYEAFDPQPKRSLYLITDHQGVPFEQDGIRDGEHLRAKMTPRFIEAADKSGAPWALLTGSRTERLKAAIRIIDPLVLPGALQ